MLSRERIDEIVRSYFRQVLESDHNWRLMDVPDFDCKSDEEAALALTLVNDEEEVDRAIEQSGKHPIHFTQDFLTKITHASLLHALEINDWREAELFVSDIVKEHGLELAKDSMEYRWLSRGILRATVEATRIILERAKGNWAAEPSDPLFRVPFPAPADPPHPPLTPPGETLVELVERFLKEKQEITNKTALDYRAAIRVLSETPATSGDVAQISRADIVRLKDLLLRAPTNWTKRFVGKSLSEVVQHNDKASLPTLSARTINSKYLSLLSTFFRWAIANGLANKNPVEGVRVLVPKRGKKSKKRLPFTTAQLQTIFTAPVFTGCRSESRLFDPGEHRLRDHRFWTPLISLWSGARLNEIGQLLRIDVRETAGVWCFQFTEDPEGDQKRIKTEAGRRVVPVHPELIKMGLLELVRETRAGAGPRLFPHWKRGEDGYYSSVFSKWFGRFLGSVGLQDPRLVFHSFRHGFKDALRRAMIEERIQDAIMGHEPEHVSSDYGLGYAPAELDNAIKAVTYPGLNLSHLYALSKS
jgi:integrase